jgi:UDP-N-acetylglucosamine 2-epimerase
VSAFVSVVGARPQFVKLAPVSRAFETLTGYGTHRIVHTGQHYDPEMSDLFFDELELPRPDLDLGVGSGPHGRQTARMMEALEAEFARARPGVVIVYGDTNSTLAATLVSTKLNIPTCHIEAGLRSFDRSMPEEINRVVADHCGDRLYAPTPAAMANLANEGLKGRAVLSGDVMLDAVRHNLALAARKSDVLERYDLEGRDFGVVTIHRPFNTTGPRLAAILDTLEQIGRSELPLLFPVHPRTRAGLDERVRSLVGCLRVTAPLGHLDMLRAVSHARVVLTDSGGVQKEAAFLGVPCITLRDSTEWTETVEMNANVLVGQSSDRLTAAVRRVLSQDAPDWSESISAHYGDGRAAQRIVEDLVRWSRGAP